jgi:DNA-binding MarR family transcriptional regulator
VATSGSKTEAVNDSIESMVVLENFMPYRLSVLSLAISQSIATLYSERFNINIMEWRVIAVLSNYSSLSANQICERTNMDKVQVSRAVSSLAKAKLVLRKTDKQDRRKSELRLSAKGKNVYKKIVPLALEWEKKLMSALNAQERKEFDQLLNKLEIKAQELHSET